MTALRIGDEPLTPAAVAAAARGGRLDVELTPAARARIAATRRVAEAAAAHRPVYGRTTGVGANRHIAVPVGDLREHSIRLLRSHAGGVGDPLPEDVVRGTMLIRLAQVAAGGGGQRLEVADALVAILRDGPLPVLRDLGGIGTGDLTLLAQLGLALAGEGEWARPAVGAASEPPRLTVEAGDALSLMSSNAATFAAAALAWADVRELLDAGLGVAALTFRALDGNSEAFAAPIAAARPLPGLRCLPPVGAALHQAATALHDVLAVEINSAAENPLIAGGEVLHHGGFHAAPCALALETLRLAMVPFASMTAARLAHLMEPGLTGLTPFLAIDAPGSSGVLIAEYLAADAVARLRADAAPVVLGTVAISRGLEEHASFAWQAAGQTRHAVYHLRTVLALEWVVAERALRMKGVAEDGVLGPIRALAGGFDPSLEDRPLGPDAALAETALPALARTVRDIVGIEL